MILSGYVSLKEVFEQLRGEMATIVVTAGINYSKEDSTSAFGSKGRVGCSVLG